MKIKYMIALLAFAPLLASESSAQQAATPAELAATEQVKQKLNNIIIPELNSYDLHPDRLRESLSHYVPKNLTPSLM